MPRYLSLLLILLAINSAGYCQIAPDSLFSSEALESDLDTLYKTILSSHPDPAAFCGNEAFENAYETALESVQVKDSIKLGDFAVVVSTFLSTMQDSHTSPDYYQLQNIQMNNGGYCMPLSVRKAESNSPNDDFAIVIDGNWTQGIPVGSELISINAHSVKELYNLSLPFACIEGDARIAQSTIAVALVPIVCGLHFGYKQQNEIVYKEPGKTSTQIITVKGFQRKEFDRVRKEKDKKEIQWIPTLSFIEDSTIAILRVSTFSPMSSGKYARAIRKSFAEIHEKNIPNLVIDIRGNGGGSSAWVEYLYSFLDLKGYNTPDNVIGKNSALAKSRNPLFHKRFVQRMIKLFFKKDEDVQSYQKISSLPFGEQDTVYFKKPTVQAKNLVFEGNAFLLINGLTASAGVDFTNAFRTKHRGLIVGEQCLGPTTGTWGNPAIFRMPNTHLRMTIATIRYNYDHSFIYERKAIEPDFEIPMKALDIANGKDTQIDFIKNHIESSK
jgi:C-terminal processing protease CtpA/Prc